MPPTRTPLAHRPTIIPPDAVETLHGVWTWPVNGARVVLPFLSADPLKDDEDWYADTTASLPRMEADREYGVEFVGFAGKPVYAEYQDRLHLSSRPLEYVPNRPIIRGWDIPGPLACAWVQLVPIPRPGQSTLEAAPLRVQILNELYIDCGVEEFGERVKTESASQFPQGREFVDWSDPQAFASGTGGNEKRSAAEVLRTRCGITLQPGPVDILARTEGVRRWLTRFFPSAKPGEPMGRLLIDPSCSMIRDGFKGGYHYEEIEKSGRFREVPTKNEYSHIMNALEYALSRTDSFTEAPAAPAAPLDFSRGYLGGPPRRTMA